MANSRLCSIPECGKPHKGKGYCGAHYYRLLRHGDPMGGRTSPGELLNFIHEVALHHIASDCLTWPFGKSGAGYGQLKVGGKYFVASRYVCELVHGAPPTPDHEAAHSCGKGHEGCIAPGHLSWKTLIENKDDELLHGTRPRGECHGRAKLTEAAVREIISLHSKETNSNLAELAERFSVSRSTISRIHTGRNWAWLEPVT